MSKDRKLDKKIENIPDYLEAIKYLKDENIVKILINGDERLSGPFTSETLKKVCDIWEILITCSNITLTAVTNTGFSMNETVNTEKSTGAFSTKEKKGLVFYKTLKGTISETNDPTVSEAFTVEFLGLNIESCTGSDS